MDIYSPLNKVVVRERLRDLLIKHSRNPQRIVLTGNIAEHQITVRVRSRKFSLPWRGTFRGVMISRDNGTAVTGKFDSKWSLYFVGYPIVAGVVINIAAITLAGHGAGQIGAFALFTGAAVLLCVYLNWVDAGDNRLITEAICRAIDGRLEIEAR